MEVGEECEYIYLSLHCHHHLIVQERMCEPCFGIGHNLMSNDI